MQHKGCILRIQNKGVISHGNGKEVGDKEAFGKESSFKKSSRPAERTKTSSESSKEDGF